jgi:hypothetical protein
MKADVEGKALANAWFDKRKSWRLEHMWYDSARKHWDGLTGERHENDDTWYSITSIRVWHLTNTRNSESILSRYVPNTSVLSCVSLKEEIYKWAAPAMALRLAGCFCNQLSRSGLMHEPFSPQLMKNCGVWIRVKEWGLHWIDAISVDWCNSRKRCSLCDRRMSDFCIHQPWN